MGILLGVYFNDYLLPDSNLHQSADLGCGLSPFHPPGESIKNYLKRNIKLSLSEIHCSNLAQKSVKWAFGQYYLWWDARRLPPAARH